MMVMKILWQRNSVQIIHGAACRAYFRTERCGIASRCAAKIERMIRKSTDIPVIMYMCGISHITYHIHVSHFRVNISNF